ncbi:uncharacterized protein SPPG_06452 [Spizellomyces punctatus DAOM BR117]|uniref:Uncharacterized protein n=1 Tax=Spizellomyces punctatus (strain DAOM BR117) TaxID=645134 RepID=A0A0L0HA23_SPIPD|nr:uncharacterized protein SPPG_06452 [Spizellomyces punctatus DAOM BR117]KNC98032.1 hypothetical protein SPPG_06452 [Spizellomyces punctatus DAOM BR117]|eukprot:XP_016606072.1 hypothetical protein SPPG_06452 [Spizellomyces punctatus DAOM BR117]
MTDRNDAIWVADLMQALARKVNMRLKLYLDETLTTLGTLAEIMKSMSLPSNSMNSIQLLTTTTKNGTSSLVLSVDKIKPHVIETLMVNLTFWPHHPLFASALNGVRTGKDDRPCFTAVTPRSSFHILHSALQNDGLRVYQVLILDNLIRAGGEFNQVLRVPPVALDNRYLEGIFDQRRNVVHRNDWHKSSCSSLRISS